MKTFFAAMLGAAALVTVTPSTASAAPIQSVHQRERNLSMRIDRGVRNGSLTRAEASRLRTRLANLQRLEWRYRRNGLSYRERVTLDRRFDALSRAVRVQRHDQQNRWRHRR